MLPCSRASAVWLLSAFMVGVCVLGQSSRAQTPAEAPGASEPITPIPPPPPAHPRKVALGARLFNERALSKDGTKSCASCHDVTANGSHPADAGAPAASGFDTLTVFNAVLSFRLSWEGRFRTLEEHSANSIESPRIMGGSIESSVQRLNADPDTRRLFLQAYGSEADGDNLLDAIAHYQRSLLTPNSRFDRWLKGDISAINDEEQRGYRSFKELGCITCHQGVNVGGNLYQRRSVFRVLEKPNPEVLRVPSLRNVAETAPYFHDGSSPTLTDAIRKMAAVQLNETLSDFQIQGLVAFLGTLTGEYRGRPVRAGQ